MEFIDWEKIEVNGNRSGQKKALCPNCSHTRKKKTDKCLSVNFDKGTALCWNCEAVSFRDDVKTETEKEYKLPIQTWRNYTELSDKMVKYLESRKISQSTAINLGWTEEKYYQPSMQKEVSNLVFNTFEGSILVNKKYRSGNKKFTQSAGTKSIFYNINSAVGKEKVYIVEGEFDVAALIEVGIKSVISVPNGANDNDEYWRTSEKYIKDVKQFVLAVDKDEKGIALRDKIAQRLGRHRCSYIDFNGKDANDDLISGTLKESIKNEIRFPVSGTFKIDDLFGGIMDLYENGLPDTLYPKSRYWDGFKQCYSVMRGQLNIVTGIPSHGKSNFTDDYVLNLINDYDLKASWFSPEHSPMSLYHTNLSEKVTGKNFWGKAGGREVQRVTTEELQKYKEWGNEKIYLTDCEAGNLPTWDWLLKKFEEQMYSFGIDIFVIDAFNKVLLDSGNRLEEINKVLTKLTHFAQSNNVIVFLVAHPTKMQKNDQGLYSIPTLYDVSGSADFRNQTHNGYTIYRHFEDVNLGIEDATEFFNMKTKFNFQGEIGSSVKFKYFLENGRFYTGDIPPKGYLWEKEEDMFNNTKPLPTIQPTDAFNDFDDDFNEVPF